MNELLKIIDVLIDIANCQIKTTENAPLPDKKHLMFEKGKLDSLECVKLLLTDMDYKNYLINEYKKLGYLKWGDPMTIRELKYIAEIDRVVIKNGKHVVKIIDLTVNPDDEILDRRIDQLNPYIDIDKENGILVIPKLEAIIYE